MARWRRVSESLQTVKPQRECRQERESEEARSVLPSVIDKEMVSTLNKILIDKRVALTILH